MKYLFHTRASLWRAPVRAARPGSLPLRVRGLGGSVRFPLLQRCDFPGSCDGWWLHNEFSAENHSSQKASGVQKLYHVPCDDSSNHSISFYPRVDASAYGLNYFFLYNTNRDTSAHGVNQSFFTTPCGLKYLFFTSTAMKKSIHWLNRITNTFASWRQILRFGKLQTQQLLKR